MLLVMQKSWWGKMWDEEWESVSALGLEYQEKVKEFDLQQVPLWAPLSVKSDYRHLVEAKMVAR
jgi:hypothetical protein